MDPLKESLGHSGFSAAHFENYRYSRFEGTTGVIANTDFIVCPVLFKVLFV